MWTVGASPRTQYVWCQREAALMVRAGTPILLRFTRHWLTRWRAVALRFSESRGENIRRKWSRTVVNGESGGSVGVKKIAQN
jgi:hypothetical protein